MREVRLLVAAQIRLFLPDTIPLGKIALEGPREAIRALFNFQGVEPIMRQNSVIGFAYSTGVYGPNSILIQTISIEDRRVVVKVHSDSGAANAVYQELRKKLEEFNENRPIRELVCTHETGSSVVLDFPYDRIFSRPFLSFLEKSALNYTKNQWSENLILPTNLKFTVRYKVVDDTLVKNYITLVSKELAIEPRMQSSPDERLYWIASPTDTDTHFKLIDDLEKALAEK